MLIDRQKKADERHKSINEQIKPIKKRGKENENTGNQRAVKTGFKID